MKKVLIGLTLLMLGLSATGQVYQKMGLYGYEFLRVRLDSALYIPLRDTSFSPDTLGAITARPGDSALYFYDGHNWQAFVGAKLLGTANGVATLDANGKLESDQVPAIAITNTYVVSDMASMLALDADTGDVAIRTDSSITFILQNSPASDYNNWQQLLSPGAPVTSVNGKTGAVTLTTDDVAEGTTNQYLTTDRVRSSIAGNTGVTYNQATGVFQHADTDPGSSGGIISLNPGQYISQIQTDNFGHISGPLSISTLQASDIGAQPAGSYAAASINLQQVTDNGSSTTNGISFVNTYTSTLRPIVYPANARSGAVIESNGSVNYGLTGAKSTGFAFRWLAHDNAAIDYSTNTDELMRLSSIGNLGIGTASPLYKLHSYSANNTGQVAAMIAGHYYGPAVGTESTSSTYYAFDVLSGITDASSSAAGGSSLFRVRADGNVGIGTTAPSAKLDVNGSLTAKFPIKSVTDTTVGGNYLAFYKNGGTTRQGYVGVGASTTDDMYFVADNGKIRFGTAGIDNRMLIDANGNIGIGASSPATRLDIKSTGTGTVVSRIISSTSTNPILEFYQNSSAHGEVHVYDASGNLQTAISAIGTSFFAGSNLGIKTSTPNSPLQVNGSISLPVRVITANTTLTSSDYTILNETATGNPGPLISFPAASTCPGRIYVLVDVVGHTGERITFPTNTVYFLDGTISDTGTAYGITVQSDGTKWVVIQRMN